MDRAAISRFPVPPCAELPPELAERYADVEERSGFLPNIFGALAWRPAEAAAFFALHDALMDKDTPGLPRADRELVVVATSAANDCLYCVVAHGAIAACLACVAPPGAPPPSGAGAPPRAARGAIDWRKAPVPPRTAAVLE